MYEIDRSVTSAVIVSVIISKLLQGLQENKQGLSEEEDSCTDDDRRCFTEMIQIGSTNESCYLEKFAHFPSPLPKPLDSPLKNRIVRQVRRFAAYLTNQPMNPIFESDFQIPQHAPVDIHRFDKPAPIRPHVVPIAEFGVDDGMMRLCKNVVEKYKFLLQGNSLCPCEANPESEMEKDSEQETSWVEQLHQHCFPDSLSSLKLDEKGKIGYTFKCLGAGLYVATRKKPEEMTSSEFFEHLITELLLETGDSDTNCTVAGAILGCRLGKSGLPKAWVKGLRHHRFLENISNDLCEMVVKSLENGLQ